MKTNISIVIAGAVLAMTLMLLASCSFSLQKNTKSMELKSHEYAVSGFNTIDISKSASVEYIVSDSMYCVANISDEDLEETEIVVDDGVLCIREKENNEGDKKIYINQDSRCMEVKVYGPADILEAVNIAGSGSFKCKDSLNVKVLRMDIAGSGEIDIDNLCAKKAALSIAGSGDVDLHCNDCGTVEVSIAGSGEVSLSGTARSVSRSIAGSGEIDDKELTILK